MAIISTVIPGASNGTPMTDNVVVSSNVWQAAKVVGIVDRTPGIKSIFLWPSVPFSHKAGQHVDVRLTAPDGYAAIRSYSVASMPDNSRPIELVIERLPNGEVSPYFHDVAAVEDEIEIRGPLGGHFIWPEATSGAILLVGAGSGVAPLVSMVRYRQASGQKVPTALLMSARTRRDILFADELRGFESSHSGLQFAVTLTREKAWRASDFSRRIDSHMIAEVIARLEEPPRAVYICGSNDFVNTAADGVQAIGIDASAIRTERYGG